MLKTKTMENVCMGCFTQHEAPVNTCPVCGYSEAEQPAQPHQLRPRTILNGKYLLGKVLGEGGFGITYIGYDLNLDIKVAIKEFYPTGFVTRETTSTSTVQPFTGSQGDFFLRNRDRFVKEAKRLAKFRSLPGIVTVNDYFQENGTAYIVMEHIEGQTLKSCLAQTGGKLPATQVFDMLKPVMTSLAEVHKSGIIHRDISPDNIMIGVGGHMTLLDFGAAKEFADSGQKSLSIMLKPGFSPEEQYRSRGVQGPWTDIYALCATMYKAVTGITPDESLERIREDALVPPRKTGASMTPEQEKAILNGLAVNQKDRFQTLTELYDALYEPPFMPKKPEIRPEPAPKPDNPVLPRFAKNKVAAACVSGICVIVLLIFAAIGLMSPSSPDEPDGSEIMMAETIPPSSLPSGRPSAQPDVPVQPEEVPVFAEEQDEPAPETPAPETPAPETPAPETPAPETPVETKPVASPETDFVIIDGIITKYVGPGGHVVIPDSVRGIEKFAFLNIDNIKKITIPDSVVSINEDAFNVCSVEEFYIGKGLKFYNDYSPFTGHPNVKKVVISPENPYACAIDDVIYTKDKKRIIAYPIGKTQKSFTIPQGVTSVGIGAFWGSSYLETVVIPDGVTIIYRFAFSGCDELKNVNIPDGVTLLDARAFIGCFSLLDITIPDSVTEINRECFVGYSERVPPITIHASPGSYAAQHAKEHSQYGIRFEPT